MGSKSTSLKVVRIKIKLPTLKTLRRPTALFKRLCNKAPPLSLPRPVSAPGAQGPRFPARRTATARAGRGSSRERSALPRAGAAGPSPLDTAPRTTGPRGRPRGARKRQMGSGSPGNQQRPYPAEPDPRRWPLPARGTERRRLRPAPNSLAVGHRRGARGPSDGTRRGNGASGFLGTIAGKEAGVHGARRKLGASPAPPKAAATAR